MIKEFFSDCGEFLKILENSCYVNAHRTYQCPGQQFCMILWLAKCSSIFHVVHPFLAMLCFFEMKILEKIVEDEEVSQSRWQFIFYSVTLIDNFNNRLEWNMAFLLP